MAETIITRTERPTLFVGIGGTGKQILLQMRRMCLEQYGVPTLPHHGHICIDTDARNVNIEGQDLDEFLQEVMFTQQERVDTPLEKASLARLYENETNYEHIFSWFDRQLKQQGPIKDGAGQIRSFGRLAFFLHYDKIRKAIKDKMDQLKEVSTTNELSARYGIALDPSGVDTWLIFSLAGGTGSGMFLDMAYLIGECATGRDVSRQALVLLPTAFSNEYSARIFANSYAALMELEYYNFPSRDDATAAQRATVARGFRKAWTRDMFRKSEFGLPPVFDNTWLVGNSSYGGGGSFNQSDKVHLCELMAEWLFVRNTNVAPALADRIKSDASNYTNYLTPMAEFSYSPSGQDDTEIAQIFARKYSAPGLSKIYVATRQLATEAEHRLASEVLDDWTRSGAIDARYADRLDRAQAQKLMYAENGKVLGQRLAFDSANTGIRDVLRELLASKREEFREMAADSVIADQIREWVEAGLITQRFAKESTDRTHWGSHTRTIFLQNAAAAENEIIAGLQTYIRQTLQARDERFTHAIEGLRYFIQKFRAVAESMRRLAELLQSRARDAARDAAAILEMLGDEKGLFTRRTIIKVAFEHIEDRAQAIMSRQVAMAAEQVANRIVDVIGVGRKEKNAKGEEITTETGLIRAVIDLEAAFAQMKHRLALRQQALKSQTVSPANRRLPAPGEEDGSFYVTDQGKPFTEDDVAVVSNRVLESGGVLDVTSVWDFRDVLAGARANLFLQQLLAAVAPDLAHISRDTFDVLKLIDERYEITPQDAGYAGLIRDGANKGSPMLEEPTQETQQNLLKPPPEIYSRIARSALADPHARERLEKVVKYSLPANASAILPGPRDTIYFVSERVGLPLVMIPHLNEYRNRAYLAHVDVNSDASTRVVHTELDFEKFPDLLVLNDQELKQAVEAWEVFARAVALGVIQGKRTEAFGSPIRWSYLSGDGFRRQEWYLGSLATALRDLSAPGSKHLAAIKAGIDQRLTGAPIDDRAKMLLIALKHSQEPPIGAIGWVRANQRIINRESAQPTVKARADALFGDDLRWADEEPPGFFRLK